MIIGEARSYDQLVNLIRLRIDQLAVRTESIDRVAGLPDRYTAKLIVQMKRFGMISLGPVLQALGLKLIVAVDEAAMANVARLEPSRSQLRVLASSTLQQPNNYEPISQLLGIWSARCHAAMSPRQRRERARKAAFARWRGKPKPVSAP